MTFQPVSDPNTPIGEILKAAGSEGILLESAVLRYRRTRRWSGRPSGSRLPGGDGIPSMPEDPELPGLAKSSAPKNFGPVVSAAEP